MAYGSYYFVFEYMQRTVHCNVIWNMKKFVKVKTRDKYEIDVKYTIIINLLLADILYH